MPDEEAQVQKAKALELKVILAAKNAEVHLLAVSVEEHVADNIQDHWCPHATRQPGLPLYSHPHGYSYMLHL